MTFLPDSEFRIARARKSIAEMGLQALLITDRTNIGWISGFTGSSAYIILTSTDAIFATDSRYTVQAETQCPGWTLRKLASSDPGEIVGLLSKVDATRIGFEAVNLSFAAHSDYASKIPSGTEFVPTEKLIDGLRIVKDATEIEATREACVIADRAFSHILSYIKPGVTERTVMLELEGYIRREGGAEIAFDTIVASGYRSALPHGLASEKVIESGDFVTLDFGARHRGYCSDMTRTVVVGGPTEKQVAVYNVVRGALEDAIAGVKPGVKGIDIDSIARNRIKDAGYGDYFGHGLGHSLGRAVHDGPGFSPKSKLIVEEGMIITVEPGIYIPDWGGVRIEHDILVTGNGSEILNKTPVDLISL